MSDQELKDIARRWYIDTLSGPVEGVQHPYKSTAGAIEQIFSNDYRNHVVPAPLGGWQHGLEGARQIILLYRSSFPDLLIEIDEQWVMENKVVTHYTARGTHTARPFFGLPASGQKYEIAGVGIDKIVDGKFVESWGRWDKRGLLAQMGLPTDAPAYPG